MFPIKSIITAEMGPTYNSNRQKLDQNQVKSAPKQELRNRPIKSILGEGYSSLNLHRQKVDSNAAYICWYCFLNAFFRPLSCIS